MEYGAHKLEDAICIEKCGLAAMLASTCGSIEQMSNTVNEADDEDADALVNCFPSRRHHVSRLVAVTCYSRAFFRDERDFEYRAPNSFQRSISTSTSTQLQIRLPFEIRRKDPEFVTAQLSLRKSGWLDARCSRTQPPLPALRTERDSRRDQLFLWTGKGRARGLARTTRILQAGRGGFASAVAQKANTISPTTFGLLCGVNGRGPFGTAYIPAEIPVRIRGGMEVRIWHGRDSFVPALEARTRRGRWRRTWRVRDAVGGDTKGVAKPSATDARREDASGVQGGSAGGADGGCRIHWWNCRSSNKTGSR
ncbi:hypothetical protein FB451DRAFT_1164408 [Mycena latifolia]|nr:hypothetical protein FB451DRAFT_1164408 [Mycena latifolia]